MRPRAGAGLTLMRCEACGVVNVSGCQCTLGVHMGLRYVGCALAKGCVFSRQYRKPVAQCNPRPEQELEAPFLGSFLNWRWETIAVVAAELKRLRAAMQQHFAPGFFGKLEDATLLSASPGCAATRRG